MLRVFKLLKILLGFEIHRQYDDRMLLCNCSFKNKNGPIRTKTIEHTIVSRKLKFIRFRARGTRCCDYQFDQVEPNFNKELLIKALRIIRPIENLKVSKKLLFERKTIIDKSLTAGFQRTALLASDGLIRIDDNFKVKIKNIHIEEDSGLWDYKNNSLNVDRQGLALLEITTDIIEIDKNNFRDLVKIEEFFNICDSLFRGFTNRRGIGTIRQDVNISIVTNITTISQRVEIKGFQEYKKIPKLIVKEVKEQILLERALKFSKVTSSIDDHNLNLTIEGPVKRYRNFLKNNFLENFKDLIKEISVIERGFFLRVKIVLLQKKRSIINFLDNWSTASYSAVKSFKGDTFKSSYLRPISGKERMHPESSIPAVLIDQELYKSLASDRIEIYRALRQDLNHQLVKFLLSNKKILAIYKSLKIKNYNKFSMFLSLFIRYRAKSSNFKQLYNNFLDNNQPLKDLISDLQKKTVKRYFRPNKNFEDILSELVWTSEIRENLKINKPKAVFLILKQLPHLGPYYNQLKSYIDTNF